MGKTQRALTSLVAAVPAGVLLYLLVMTFLNRADSLNMMMKVVAGVTLACAFFVVLMPILLLVLGNRKAKEAVDVDDSVAEAAVISNDDDDVADIEGDEASDATVGALDESDADVDASDEFEIDESDADIMSDSSGEFEAGMGSSLDEIESVDFEDEEEEEPKPKKRKK